MSRVALVTGSSSGIGRATVAAFSAAGWRVAATMRRPELAAELGELAGVKILPLDVASTESVEGAIESALAGFGRLRPTVAGGSATPSPRPRR